MGKSEDVSRVPPAMPRRPIAFHLAFGLGLFSLVAMVIARMADRPYSAGICFVVGILLIMGALMPSRFVGPWVPGRNDP